MKLRNRKVALIVPKTALISIVLLGIILAVVACGGQETQRTVKATWIKPQVSGDTVSVLVSEISNNTIVHFSVPAAQGGEMAFMAYEIDGKLDVRANVCPPCRSIGFSLNKETLICDTCRTTFKAKTGDGITGACVNYPKASVPYEVNSGKVIMNGDSLLTAYQNTLTPGLP